jgi:hypothetical protein
LEGIEDHPGRSEGDRERVSTAYIFDRVSAQLESNEVARSLWLKLRQEVDAGGVPTAMGYLNARFKELSERVVTAIPGKGRP